MKREKRNLIIFIIVVLACGWFGVLIDQILTEQPEGNSLGMGLWLVLPILTAIIIRIREHDWKSFGIGLHLKKGWKWYIVAILMYPVITLITLIVAKLCGCMDITNSAWDKLVPLALASIGGSFVKNIFEEFAWRGHLTPKLIKCGFSDWVIYGLSGLIWGLWHSAYYLCFLADEYFQTTSRVGMVVIGCIVMMAWSIFFVEIYRITKSVWPCVLLHSMEDAIPTVIVTTEGFVQFTKLGSIVFDPITGIVSVVIMVIAGLLCRKYRKNMV